MSVLRFLRRRTHQEAGDLALHSLAKNFDSSPAIFSFLGNFFGWET